MERIKKGYGRKKQKESRVEKNGSRHFTYLTSLKMMNIFHNPDIYNECEIYIYTLGNGVNHRTVFTKAELL